jgi:hypothetical protein
MIGTRRSVRILGFAVASANATRQKGVEAAAAAIFADLRRTVVRIVMCAGLHLRAADYNDLDNLIDP